MSKIYGVLAIAWLLSSGLFSDAKASTTISPTGLPCTVDICGIEDGLPGSSVISVIQTRDGYLWLGTLYGLVRFDGLHFTSFDEANTPGLNSSRIVKLFEDSRGDLWAGTENAGVALIKKSGEVRNFDLGRGSAGGSLISICEDTNGVVWLLTGDNQLGRYQNDKLDIAPARGCKTIMVEKSGPLWMGTAQGLFSISKTTTNAKAFLVDQFIPVNGKLDFLLAGQKGGFWALADGRIQKYKGSQRVQDLAAYPWGATPVMAACEDLEGNLIVGTYGAGVYWFDSQGKYIHLGAGELGNGSILSLTMDREGGLWIGTNGGGLAHVKRKMFGVLASSDGKTVQAVSEDAKHGLWIGYNEDRVEHWDGARAQTFAVANSPYAYTKSIFVDRAQRVWGGMWFAGDPCLFQFENGIFQRTFAGVSLRDISAIYEDSKGTLWFGTQDGLAVWNGRNWKRFTTRDGLPANDVRAIAPGADGSMWIGTGAGLAQLQGETVTALRKKDGLPSEDVSALLVDADGVLWVATRGSGLARFAKNRWTHYTTRDGLAANSIGYLIEDGLGNLWLGSNGGLMRIPKKSLNDFADGTAESINCRAYVEADGLPTRECTQGSQPAACRTADGQLWFPTTKGLVSVNPAALKPNRFQPPVVIESIAVEGREQSKNPFRTEPAEVVLRPGQQRLEIHYTSLNVGSAAQARFRYKLEAEGQKVGWNDVGGVRSAIYTKLPPGRYHFEVTACNEDGEWNATPLALEIIVKPPFWKTWWFSTVSGIAFVVLVVALVYYFSTQKLQRELALVRQQEALERERGRIARDLHDQLGANLMQISLLGEMAETDKDLPEEVESHAEQITATARETAKALDEIVWAVNPSNDTLEGLMTYATKYAQEYFALAGLRYRLEVPRDLPDHAIAPDVRHNVFLAFKEAVNNVVKHAQATEAHVRLRFEAQRFLLEIEDNGRGPAAAAEKSGRNGLRNMRRRLEDVGGSFSMEPAPEKGTIVRLTVPLKDRT